jgi:hypothetical protein
MRHDGAAEALALAVPRQIQRSTSPAKTVETGSFSYHIRPISPPPLSQLLFFFYFISLTYLEEFSAEAVTQRTASAGKTLLPN